VQLDDLLLTDVPEDPNWFYDACLSPIKTLLLFLYNFGHAYFPFLEHNLLPHSTDCPAIMKQAWDYDDNVPDNVRKLHSKLLEEVVTEEAIQARVVAFSERMKLDGILPSCGSCGIWISSWPRRRWSSTGPEHNEANKTRKICLHSSRH
jgi:hypothetical protein